MSADVELFERYKTELAQCVTSEVTAWESKSRHEIVQRLANGSYIYDANFKGAQYSVVVELLEQTLDDLHILISVQPYDHARISAIATPRDAGSGGWTDVQTGSMSQSFIVQTPM